MSEPISLSALIWEGDRAPLAKAFVAAQKATESIKKAATNPAFRSKYADLAHVVEGVVPALNEAGVGVMQFPSFNGDLVGVTTTLLHESGASVTGTLHMRPTKNDPQGVGSAITYARRYSLLAITGSAPEDDDGNAASGPKPGARREISPGGVGPDFEGAEGSRGRSSYSAKKDGGGDRFNAFRKEIEGLESMVAVGSWQSSRLDEIKALPEAWRKQLREDLEEQKRVINAMSQGHEGDELAGFRGEGAGDMAGRSGQVAA